MKIALGSTSAQKAQYLKEVLQELNLEASIIPTEVESGVSEQPITLNETREGSINRAKESLKKRKDADFAVGIEIGYEKNKSHKYEIFCCSTIVDRKNSLETCYSEKLELPDYFQKLLDKNEYLGNYVKEYMETENKQLGEIILSRKPFIIKAIRDVLHLYLKPDIVHHLQ